MGRVFWKVVECRGMSVWECSGMFCQCWNLHGMFWNVSVLEYYGDSLVSMCIEDIKERSGLQWDGNISACFLTGDVTEDLYSARIESLSERN